MYKPLAGSLLVSDVDGTLITKDFRLLDKNIEAIKKFTELGGAFTLASGRSHAAVLMYSSKVNITCPLITYNGAAIYDTNAEKLIWQLFLPGDARNALLELLREFPDTGAEIHSQGKIYLIQNSPEAQRHVTEERLEYEESSLDLIPPEMPVNKILFAAPTARLRQMQEYAAEHITLDGAYLMFTSPIYFEMIPSEANKGTALKQLIEICGYNRDKVYAIGDYVNDIPMLKEAAYSAAIGSAPDEVKAHAQYFTCSNNDGAVADFIEHIISKMPKTEV